MRELYSLIVPFVQEKVLKDRVARGLPTDATTMTKEYALQIHSEVSELIGEFPWKHHRAYGDYRQIRNNVAEELVDIIFFAISAAYVNDISADELLAAANVKSVVVNERWRQEKQENQPWSDKGVIIVDLDGVLNEYPGPFVEYANSQLQIWDEWVSWEWLNKPENRGLLTQLKHGYRQSGIKRRLPPITANVQAVQELAAKGYDIVLMSTRPAKQYSNIYGDTLYWLKHHDVPFRKLWFVEDKELQIVIGNIRDRVVFAVDDDPDNVDKLRDLGIKTYFVTKREPRERYDILTMEEIEL